MGRYETADFVQLGLRENRISSPMVETMRHPTIAAADELPGDPAPHVAGRVPTLEARQSVVPGAPDRGDGAPSALPSDAIDVQALGVIASLDPDGTAGLLDRILDLFVTDSESQLAQLRDALSAGDAAVARRIVHTLKSSAASVGAQAVSALSAQLEARAAAGDLAAVAAQSPRLESLRAAAVRNLQVWRASLR